MTEEKTVMMYRGVRLEDMTKEALIDAVRYYAIREDERLKRQFEEIRAGADIWRARLAR